MRFVTVRIVSATGGLHPLHDILADEPAISRTALHHFNVLADGTVVTLLEFEGDRERLEDTANHPALLWREVSDGDSPETFYVYSRVRVTETIQQLFAILENHELVLDPPMEFGADGGLTVTAIGDLETFRSAIESVPEDVEINLETTGEYRPDAGRLYSILTDRQREILQSAVDIGYYEVPRRATYEDVAAELDIAAGTVGEHLRKIEAVVLQEVLP